MSFKEEYPHLFHDGEGIGRCEEHGLYLYNEGIMHTCKLGCVYPHSHKNIHENCLNKQRVRDYLIRLKGEIQGFMTATPESHPHLWLDGAPDSHSMELAWTRYRKSCDEHNGKIQLIDCLLTCEELGLE